MKFHIGSYTQHRKPKPLWYMCILFYVQSLQHAFCGEKLALLSSTLRTYHRAACDTDQILIACPRGTSISIEIAQYNKYSAKDGISIEELCPTKKGGTIFPSKAKHLLRGSIFGASTQNSTHEEDTNLHNIYEPEVTSLSSNSNAGKTVTSIDRIDSERKKSSLAESCMWPNALQYSLLQTVVEACQKKKHCKFIGMPSSTDTAATGNLNGSIGNNGNDVNLTSETLDPCMKRKKIIEIAYKCRPFEFRSKVACHNDVAQLVCNPYSRIVVYSASFGRTEYESIQCPQPQGVREETCLASYATETVMQICHGRRRCNIAADANTFGTPCQPNSRMYLKVVYTCVPRQVLKDRFESDNEADEQEDFEDDNDLYDDDLIYKESEAIPKLYSNISTSRKTNSTKFEKMLNTQDEVNKSLNLHSFQDTDKNSGIRYHSLEDDHEALYLYLLIATSLGVILCVISFAARAVVQRRNTGTTDLDPTPEKGECKGKANSEVMSVNGFNDEVSEIDADIGVTTQIPLPSVSKNENYLTYAPAQRTYDNFGPSDTLYQSSTPRPQGNVPTSGASGYIATSLVSGHRQSPDIIGISNKVLATSSRDDYVADTNNTNMFVPTVVINNGSIVASSGISSGCSGIDVVMPLSSLAQYTTAPTYRTGYLLNSSGLLQQAGHISAPSSKISNTQGGTETGSCHLNQLSTSTLWQVKSTSPPILQLESTYDGIAPRTLSTGVPVNSQFYYG